MRRSRNSGYVLVEMTSALFVLTVGVLGTMRAYDYGIDSIRAMRESSLAMQRVQNEIETLRALPFGALQDGAREEPIEDADLANASLHVELSPDSSASPHLKQVLVTVSWTAENGRRASRSGVTLIAEKAP